MSEPELARRVWSTANVVYYETIEDERSWWRRLRPRTWWRRSASYLRLVFR